MAFFNEIGAGRYNRFLQKLFNMKGGPPARQLGTDLTAILPLFNGNENRIIEQWYLYARAIDIAAVAAQFPFAQLRNPPGTNVVGVVHKITLSEAGGDVPAICFTNLTTADAGVNVTAGMDSRNVGSSSLVASAGTQAANPLFAATGLIWQATILGSTPYDYVQDSIQEIPVLPGETLRVTGQTVNQRMQISFSWRERALEDSEIKS